MRININMHFLFLYIKQDMYASNRRFYISHRREQTKSNSVKNKSRGDFNVRNCIGFSVVVMIAKKRALYLTIYEVM